MMAQQPASPAEDGKRRRATRWLVAGLAVFVSLTLGPSVLDGIDAEYPWRAEVRAHASPADLQPRLSGASAPRARARIEAALAVLPPGLARLSQEHGATLELLTLDELNRRYPSHDELSHNAGIYDPDKRVLYLTTDGNSTGQTALHEYGHLVDDALGRLSSSGGFASVADEAEKQPRLRRYYVSAPAETFAELFARYYYSDRTRARLKREHPLGFEYFRALEASHLE